MLEDRVTPTAAVTQLTPAVGPAVGNTLVTITGTGFTGVTDVDFGTMPVSGFTSINSTTITVLSPPGTDPVNVTVTTTGGTSPTTPADVFTYAPTIIFSSPSFGSSGRRYVGVDHRDGFCEWFDLGQFWDGPGDERDVCQHNLAHGRQSAGQRRSERDGDDARQALPRSRAPLSSPTHRCRPSRV